MSDIISRVLSHAPVDTRYVGGLWHPGRASFRGIWTEARVWGSCLMTPANRDIKKFLIVSRARSGSTLLTQLLNSHPDVHCARELLAKRVLFPGRYLNQVCRKSTMAAYGLKILSYQMVQVQRFRDPAGFLGRLEQNGFRLIHLKRDTFSQTLSLAMAQTSGFFHQKDNSGTEIGKKGWSHTKKSVGANGPVHVNTDDFIRRIEWSDMLLEYEHHCLRGIPHLSLSYEEDLQNPEGHQPTADRTFDWIGISRAPVSSGLKKLLPSDPRSVIANYDDLARAMEARGMSHLLPE
jgi:LPS sulfotransferase NodH